MGNSVYIDLTKRIIGLSGQWLYAINADPEQLGKFLSALNFEIFTINGSLINDDESLFRQVEKGLNFPPNSIVSWGMWDEYWYEFVEKSTSLKTAIILRDSDHLYETNTQLYLRSIYDMFNIILGLERRPHDAAQIHCQAVLFALGKGKGYTLIEPDQFTGSE